MSTETTFEIGARVRIHFGSNIMTVVAMCAEQRYLVSWLAQGKQMRANFAGSVLETVEAAESPVGQPLVTLCETP